MLQGRPGARLSDMHVAMKTRRIHATGAAGAGVTTLGRALADDLAIPHHETDDYFWIPTSPPFLEKRAVADRLTLMKALFVPRPEWVLSGSLCGWGDPLVPNFDAVIFVRTRTEVRLKRLRNRELRRCGPRGIMPGGSNHQQFEALIDYASHYDEVDFTGRSRVSHEAWLQTLNCPVICVDGERKIEDLRSQIVSQLAYADD